MIDFLITLPGLIFVLLVFLISKNKTSNSRSLVVSSFLFSIASIICYFLALEIVDHIKVHSIIQKIDSSFLKFLPSENGKEYNFIGKGLFGVSILLASFFGIIVGCGIRFLVPRYIIWEWSDMDEINVSLNDYMHSGLKCICFLDNNQVYMGIIKKAPKNEKDDFVIDPYWSGLKEGPKTVFTTNYEFKKANKLITISIERLVSVREFSKELFDQFVYEGTADVSISFIKADPAFREEIEKLESIENDDLEQVPSLKEDTKNYLKKIIDSF